MLRSLDSGVSGLQAQQTMLDVVGNNIANVNTTGYKASEVDFESTLSQILGAATAPTAAGGGTNPSEVGLGVRVASTDTNWTEGSATNTGVGTNLMINGDGFFIVNDGGTTEYTRAGDFTADANGNLVSPDGAIVQGWSATNGVINTGAAPSNLTIPLSAMSPAVQTTQATITGNLPEDATAGTTVPAEVQVYDASGDEQTLSVTFTRTATGWDASASDPAGDTGTDTLTFDNGALTGGGSMTVGGMTVDLSQVTGFAGTTSAAFTAQNGNAAGTLTSYTIGDDGTIDGTFSNGEKEAIGQVALANFGNPSGLESVGNSNYTATANSGLPEVGAAGTSGIGSLTSGEVEGSNVDLSQEFTNLIVAERAFQASARVITTSDDILQSLTSLQDG